MSTAITIMTTIAAPAEENKIHHLHFYSNRDNVQC